MITTEKVEGLTIDQLKKKEEETNKFMIALPLIFSV